MKRFIFYLLKMIAFCCRAFSPNLYKFFVVKAHRIQHVKFAGSPEYIDYTAHLDASGGLCIGNKVVISTKVIVLTHDWSFLVRVHANSVVYPSNQYQMAYKAVSIGDYSFIGAGAIILPGSNIGKYCIVGAGAVVKGEIEDYAIIIGNPASKIGDTRYIRELGL